MTALAACERSAVNTYVINLSSSPQRLKVATEILRQAGIEFRRIEAVDGRKTPARDFPEYHDKLARRKYGRPMSGGEVGCFLSHRRCLEEFLRSSDRYALVLEDDIRMPASFHDTLGQILAWLENTYQDNWDLVNLGNPPKKYSRLLNTFQIQGSTFQLHLAHYFPLGTFSLLWNRQGAEAFLGNSETIYAPIDQYLRDWCAETARGLALTPPPVGVDRSQSYLKHRLSDRLKTNLLSYLVFKNIRLLKNNYTARGAMQVGFAKQCDSPCSQHPTFTSPNSL